MTTITTASGRTRDLPADLDLEIVAGLDPDGRIVVDWFDGLNPDRKPTKIGEHTLAVSLFGLTLCCNASDKGCGGVVGVVCRGCYGEEEVGRYLYRDEETKTFPELDPVVSVDGRRVTP